MASKSSIKKRHSKWYEQLLLNKLTPWILGLSILNLAIITVHEASEIEKIFSTILFTNTCFTSAYIWYRQSIKYPGTHTLSVLLPGLSLSTLAIYLTSFWITSYQPKINETISILLYTHIWFFCGFVLGRRFRVTKVALIPLGKAYEFTGNDKTDIRILNAPYINNTRFDAIVADLHSDELTSEWERFLAECTLAGIPVYHYSHIQESLTGRVPIQHLRENLDGHLSISQQYYFIKRIVDFTTALALLPALIFILAILAIIIKIDSKGPIFFIQPRVGENNRIFKIIKLRSMHTGTKETHYIHNIHDPRITRCGRWLRKYRLDELPQIFNVIIGDMSFIGPRPESQHLAKIYEEKVPFFSYRHCVKPGISGWAQVNQGHTTQVHEMMTKLEYDFFYIRNFSLWLDLLISIRTIKIIITGNGAR
ncbi:sugar transferase [Nitrincola tapanii]|uniref:Sugar transferase n=1 Tax=Nitrincola tapanii TaxID=1708751 RepID=A0A5A9W2Q5_9GAMM|nr:sugar transferase [Nitrincola tapanii]KAA0874375.1 sugar transferase [Nitrincola tapanii]